MIPKKLESYRKRMQEIKRRLDVTETLIRGEGNLSYLLPTVECIYLQLRNVLELIATASLVVNEDDERSVTESCHRKWHAGDILTAIETVNPDYYYPQPIRLVKEDYSESIRPGIGRYMGELQTFKGDYLTRERFTTLYSISSEVIHTPNPFNPKGTKKNTKSSRSLRLLRQAPKWHQRIINLVSHHKFMLPGKEGTMYVCYTDAEIKFQIAIFQQMDVGHNPTPEDMAAARTTTRSS